MNEDNSEELEMARKMLQHLQREQAKSIQYGLAEGFLMYKEDGRLTHTMPEDLDVDPYAVFQGLEDVLKEIYNLYNQGV
jgi:hypothetical protein